MGAHAEQLPLFDPHGDLPAIENGGPPVAVDLDFDALERAMLAVPQAPTPTTHHFGPGTYIRQMFAAADTLVLGREHRGPCMNIMLTGRCVLIDADGSTQELTAPHMFVSPPGRKLAYVIEDMTWVNIWATTETDLAALERELFVTPAPPGDDFACDMAEIGFTVEEVETISAGVDDLNLFCPVRAQVKSSTIHGRGCFSLGELAGDYLGPARINGHRTVLGRYTNHSRTPNVEFRAGLNGDIEAYALREVPHGEELTVDYRQAWWVSR